MVVSPNFALFKPVKSFFKVIVTLVPSFATLILSSPEKSTVSPGLTCVAFSLPLVDKFQPLLATDSTSFNWLPLMASVESAAIRPAATPLILPLWSMVTLLLIVTVPPFPMRIEDEPLVIDSIPVKSLFKPIFTLVPSLVPSLVTVKLVSSGLKSTVSPGLTVVVPPWAVVRFQPLLAVSVAESALLLTCFNCATLTASVSSLPAATCVIWRVIFFSVSPTETAPCVDIQVDWAISLIWVGAKAPFSPAALSATDDVPKATPPYTLAFAAPPKATAFSAVACDEVPIAVANWPLASAAPPKATVFSAVACEEVPIAVANLPSAVAYPPPIAVE